MKEVMARSDEDWRKYRRYIIMGSALFDYGGAPFILPNGLVKQSFGGREIEDKVRIGGRSRCRPLSKHSLAVPRCFPASGSV